MDTLNKLQLLSDASQYDLACACGTNSQDRRTRGTDGSWLYPVSMPRGGTTIMLKSLMSNVCVNDCKYCPYRDTVDVPRCTIGPDEMAGIFSEYVRKKDVFGLFLSSGVIGTPDRTMQLLTDTARIVRKKYAYKGFVHLKIIPGSSRSAIEEALSLASAVSLNIETPGANRMSALSSKKDYLRDIIEPLQFISDSTSKGATYAHVRKTTQFIVGATTETDAEIVKYTAGLYNKLKLNRVYFSAYQRGLGDKILAGEQQINDSTYSFIREHRLYQVDFLFRQYGFTESDIMFTGNGSLFSDTDPKMVWAEHHPEYFPVNVNRASKWELLRVPGLGPDTANKIIKTRKKIKINNLGALPLSVKRRSRLEKYLVC
jgi:predicted DNA-binding helix-hairpin-helix protein